MTLGISATYQLNGDEAAVPSEDTTQPDGGDGMQTPEEEAAE